MRCMENQREIHFCGDLSEPCEAGIRLRVEGGVCCALAVPWQADFSDCADRGALVGDHVEHRVGVEVGLIEPFGMKAKRWINDAGKFAREVHDFAIRRWASAGHDYRRHALVKCALD